MEINLLELEMGQPHWLSEESRRRVKPRGKRGVKYNPHHDEHGRFSSGPGSGGGTAVEDEPGSGDATESSASAGKAPEEEFASPHSGRIASAPIREALRELKTAAPVNAARQEEKVLDVVRRYRAADAGKDYEALTEEERESLCGETELRDRLRELFDKAEVQINFDPQRLMPTRDQGELRRTMIEEMSSDLDESGSVEAQNLYMVGTGGGATDERMRRTFENDCFGIPWSGVDDAERPKYACMNWNPKATPFANADQYGDCAFVLRKSVVLPHATMTPEDSAACDVNMVAPLEEPENAVLRSYAGLLALGVSESRAKGYVYANTVGTEHSYQEVQIWGNLPLNADTVDKIRIRKYEGETEGGAYYRAKPVIELAQKLGVPFEFVQKPKGQR